MKAISFLKPAGIVLLIVTLLACQDHIVEPERPRFRIRQTLYESRFTYGYKVFESYSTVVYIYDNMRRLSGYVTYPAAVADPESTNKQVTQLQYDQQGRLIISETLRGGNYGTSKRVTYDYDASGKLYRLKYFNQYEPTDDFKLMKVDSLTYSGNVLTQTTTYPGTAPDIVNTGIFTFTNGNVTKLESIYVNKRPRVLETALETGSAVLTYDDKPNLFYGHVFPELNVVEQLSRNNVLRENEIRSYDSNGLLVKKGSFMYFYEPY